MTIHVSYRCDILLSDRFFFKNASGFVQKINTTIANHDLQEILCNKLQGQHRFPLKDQDFYTM